MTKEEWLLSKIAEEGGEVSHMALKAQKYGINGVAPNQTQTNWQKLQEELVDLLVAINEYDSELMFYSPEVFNRKRKKMLDMIKVSEEHGYIKKEN